MSSPIPNPPAANKPEQRALILVVERNPIVQRTLRIIKTRGSAHDNREHELQITNKGVVVKKA